MKSSAVGMKDLHLNMKQQNSERRQDAASSLVENEIQ